MKLNKIASVLALTALSVFASHSVEAKLKVMATFTVLEDIAKNIAGDAAEVHSLTPVGAEIHDYEPTPKDLVKLAKADLILSNGLNLERWFSRFYGRLGNKVPQVTATEGIEPMYILSGPYKGTPNPHSWMSVKNAYIYIQNVENALAKYDPENAAIYHKNAAAYRAKIQALQARVEDYLKTIDNSNIYLITSESAFSYFAKDFNFKYDSLWPINAENEGTPQQITRMVKLVKEQHIPVLFSGSSMNPKPMMTVVNETGAKFGGYLYVDTLSEKDGPVPTYLDMLDKNTKTIVEAFKQAYSKK